MSLENYEGTAIDTSVFQEPEVQPIESPEQTDVVETVEPQVDEGITTNEPPEPEKINVPGLGEFTADEIKEWRQGNLRQSDYTRKTQELARQRDKLKNAEELFNYVNANPHLIEAMKKAERGDTPVVRNASPEAQMIQELAYNQKALEVDLKLNALKEKYGDIDEVALFNKAAELKTEDLEFVWKGLMAENNVVDMDSIMEKVKADLKAELEAGKTAVSTTVGTSQQTQPMATQISLTEDQKRVAAGMGMTEAEYIKWMEG